MKIELLINDEKKMFVAPIIPMRAKRKFLELQSRDGINMDDLTVDELDELFSILSDVVFKGQFTLDDLYNGAEEDYLFEKIGEVVLGKKTTTVNDEGNEKKSD